LIKMYKLKVKLSKLVDGKRKPKTKKELGGDISNCLEIRKDGEIVYKGKGQNESPDHMTVKSINADDEFYIYDNQGKSESINLTNVYKLNEVNVYNNPEDILSVTGDNILIPWNYMTEASRAVEKFDDYVYNLRNDEYPEYEKLIDDSLNVDSSFRIIQVFIYRGKNLVGLIRSDVHDTDLTINYVFVNDKYQGKGYVGEMLSLLFEYLMHSNIFKNIKMVGLTYASNSESGWIAYDKGISRYGFKNTDLNYTNEDLKDKTYVKEIHTDLINGDDMMWEKVKKGGKMLVRPIEALELSL